MSANMPPPTHHRRPSRSASRSNSISSSLVTVKKSASVSSKTNPRANVQKQRATSPGDLGLTDDYRPSRTALAPPRESVDDSQPINNRNINRWSHSTSSSISGIDTEAARKRMQDSSRRLSVSSAFAPNGYKAAHSPERVRNTSRKRLDPQPDPSSQSQTLSHNQRLHQNGRSPNASAPALTPTSMFNTATTDYFNDGWHHRKQSSKLGDQLTAMSISYTTSANQKVRRIDDAAQPKAIPPQPVSPRHIAVQEHRTPRIAEPTQQSGQSPEHRRGRGHRSPTQKTMLSKALAKANNAVLLDNAQNIDGAIEAYAEACDLLEQVMMRSSDAEDQKKLSAIQSTYSCRIAELHDLDDSFAGLMDKALPDDPPSSSQANGTFFGSPNEPTTAEVLERVHIPPRQESLLPSIFGGERYIGDPMSSSRRVERRPPNLAMPMESQYMPPPLSPRRPPSPPLNAQNAASSASLAVPQRPGPRQHARQDSKESISWLNTVDDAASSHSSSPLSSFHMETSSFHMETSKTATMADEIEAEFDAAVNAAVNAAYDDDMDVEDTPRPDTKFTRGLPQPSSVHPQPDTSRGRTDFDAILADEELDDDTTEEEERLLDEMTQGFVFDDFRFDDKSKSALPRQSDSSSFSNRTASSSIPSTTLTNGTTLSTLAEDRELPKPPPSKNLPPPPPAPLQQAPPPPQALPPQSSPPKAENRFSGINLRDRRLSGQSARQLKIETYAPTRGTSQTGSKNGVSMPRLDIPATEQPAPHTAPLPPIAGPPSSSTQATQPATPITSVHSRDSPISASPATPALTQGGSQGSLDDTTGAPSSPLRTNKAMPPPPPAPMRKNLSSSSLRMRNLSQTTNEESPLTPNSAVFPDGKKGVPPLPTPTHPTFTHQTSFSGGMYLFDDHIGAPMSPKTPRTPSIPPAAQAPAALEPCPESFLLRPWWLTRCLYQVIAHPRGGYLSTKLFVPRDIWRVRNVKLKLVEEKVAQCDILTAALLQIAQVNHFDADAVLIELQSFESVLDQVRIVLQKKLGSDVGLSSSTNVFKSPTDESEPLSAKATNASAAKSFASSWRKLRSKSSSAGIPTATVPVGSKDVPAPQNSAGLTMSSLPMTSSNDVQTSRSYHSRNRPPPPTPSSLPNIPINHSTYMASLARLFDASQVLDNVARQVVDPGLKCSSETLVGLELSVRNAAEFFAFYIIRFVMADIGLLVDKFLKRGTEWVLA